MIVHVIGVGPGAESELTQAAREAILQSEWVFGAERLLIGLEDLLRGKEQIALTKALEIEARLREFQGTNAAVLLSGDIGFYSGSQLLIPLLLEQGYQVNSICGISSLVYFCSKLKLPWQDVKTVSLHGRSTGSIVGSVMNEKKVFFLTDGRMTVANICRILSKVGLGHLTAHGGEKLSYEGERIHTGTVSELACDTFDPLGVLLVENKALLPPGSGHYGFPDDAFLRGTTPMTKEEVRAVAVSKLGIEPDSIVYDVGAGTGSVSVEMAYRARLGTVYAIERKAPALELLERNKKRFGLYHMEIVEGEAPLALIPLPAPDRVFVGGSSGNLEAILSLVLQKNSDVRIVITAVTLETLTKAVSTLEWFDCTDVEICQVAVSRAKSVGQSHMMIAQNPVFIISGNGKGVHKNGKPLG